jgi:hypothetical protein
MKNNFLYVCTSFCFLNENDMSLFKDDKFSKLLPNDVEPLVEWKRLGDLFPRPVFFANAACVCDWMQGSLGNCFIISAVHNILLKMAAHAPLFKCAPYLFQIFDPSQGFEGDKYTGKFVFYFYDIIWNRRKRVEIDDFIPMIDSKPLFGYSASGETWSLLLEKALIKHLCGSYRAANEGGNPNTVFQALLPKKSASIYRISKLSRESLTNILRDPFCFVTAAIAENESVTRETVLSNGLVTSHAFSVVGDGGGSVAEIVNPWQNHVEYTWQRFEESARQRCVNCPRQYRDGYWLMSADEILQNFDTLLVFKSQPLQPCYYFSGGFGVPHVASDAQKRALVVHVLKCRARVPSLSVFFKFNDNAQTVERVYKLSGWPQNNIWLFEDDDFSHLICVRLDSCLYFAQLF